LLITVEVVVDRRVSPLIGRFLQNKIIRPADVPAFNAAVNSAMRIGGSAALEGTLLMVVYTFGLWLWHNHVALTESIWYRSPASGLLSLSPAGYWNAYISIPIFQFVLLRWCARILIWFRLLWHISRLDLRLNAGHPDRAGGIGFLGASAYAFSPILVAEGTLVSGVLASRILYGGQSLTSFKVEIVTLIVTLVLFLLGPLVMFTPKLDRTRRAGLAAFGTLAGRYAFSFEDKWLHGPLKHERELLGSADMQSYADLCNVYATVRSMRLVPFSRDDMVRLALATAAPLLPLVLTMISFQDLVSRLVKLVL
jgi:hypothetical protein